MPYSFHYTSVLPNTELALYLHWHNEAEFLYLEDGEVSFYIENQEYDLKKGDAIFIPPNTLHYATLSSGAIGCKFFAIVFSLSVLFDYNVNPLYRKYVLPIMVYNQTCSLHLHANIEWHQKLISHLIHMYQQSRSNMNNWSLSMLGMFYIVWQDLYNHHLCHIKLSPNTELIACRIQAAIDYIHTNYDKELSLSILALSCNYSEGQFCRLFKQITHYTPIQYLKRYRILKSCHYLSNTTKKISDIALLCGFNNISYFNREFIKIMNITPLSYRRNLNLYLHNN